MRRDISTIGVFSMAVSFVAAVVLCMQTAQLAVRPGIQLSSTTLGTLEIGFFGVAVLVWRRSASLSGWVVGIAALLAVRLALSAACAYGLAGFHPGPLYAQGTVRAAHLLPRVSATLFSLMVFYPLRGLLPDRLGRRQRATESASGEGMAVEQDSVWLLRGDESLRVQRHEREQVGPVVTTFASPDQFKGAVELPLRVFLSGLPSECLAKDAEQYGDSFPVSVPLVLIVPQLTEAQVVVSVSDLRPLLPPGVLSESETHGSEGEPTLVCLALEEVVSHLPAEALELPPPSPPAWADLPDPEPVVFATV